MDNLIIAAVKEQYMPLIILGALIAFFGLIIIGVIIAKKYIKPLQINKDDITEEQAAEEELNRVLVPIEDEEIQKQMEEDKINNGK